MDVSDELARRLLDAAPDATVIADRDGTIVYANARVKEVLGYEPEKLVGAPVEALLLKRYRDIHPKHRTDFSTSPNPRSMGAGLELYARHKDGHEFPVEISLGGELQNGGSLWP